MKNSKFLFLILMLTSMALPANAFPGGLGGTDKGNTGAGPTIWNRQAYAGALKPAQGAAPEDQGGRARTQNQEQKTRKRGLNELSGGKNPVADRQAGVLGDEIKLDITDGEAELFKRVSANTDGRLTTNAEVQIYLANFASVLAAATNAPDKQMHSAKANLDSQAMEMANALGDLEKQQAASAIDFCSSFLINFSTDGGNKWNKLRDGIFVPMAILLLLPGAMLTQVKSIMAAGNPVLGESNPFEGIQRAMIAIFLIPGTYLVINYSIDLNNSITFSIADEYRQIFGTDMYRDAISFHIRAFPVRQPGENRNALDQQQAQMGPLLNGTTAFARFEGMMIENKIEDPVAGIYIAPPDRADEALPAAVIAAKEMFNSTNATFMIAWNILCAFQMIYFYYLWFVGPITAALWAWPMKSLRGAFPSWCEGVITLGFWSLFWNTSILLMACFRGVDETGTLVITALNFLATSSVKYAFDFAGLAKAAGQEASAMAEKAMQAAKKGGGGGGKGGGGSKSAGHAGASGHAHRAEHADATPASSHEDSGVGAHVQLASYSGSSMPAGFTQAVAYGGERPTEALIGGSLRSLPHVAGTAHDATPHGISLPPSADRHPGAITPDAPGAERVDHEPPPMEDGRVMPISFHPDGGAGAWTNMSSVTESSLAHAAGFTTANAGGLHATHLHGQSGHGAIALGQHGLSVGADGKFYAQNNAGDNVEIKFDADGRATLADGAVVQKTDTDQGTELSVFSSASDTVASDNYLVQSLCDSDISVYHSDMQHNAIDSMTMSSAAGGEVHAQAYDAQNRRTYAEDLNASGMLKTTNYDPKTQDVTGFSVYQPVGSNGSLTSFYDRDSVALGATYMQMNDNGFNSTVYNADGQAVSYEQDVFNADGSYSIANANINEDGSFYNSQLTSYASDSSIISASAIDNNLYAAAVGGDITNIGQIAAMPQFSEGSNNMTCPVNGTYASAPGAETINLGSARSAELAAAAAAHSEDYRRSALESHAVTQLGASSGVVPDVNVFGHSQSSTSQGQVTTVASSTSSGYSQSTDVSNSYATPVVTSSVEVVPPISFGTASGSGAGSVEYSRQSTDGNGYGTVQVDQDITNVRASDAAQRIAFDASPTSYHSVDQSVDSSVATSSVDSSSFQTAQSLHSVQYTQSSPSLMDQVSQTRSDAAFRAVEAHNMAAEVRSQIVPDSQQSVISTGGLSQQVQNGHHAEYYAAPAAPSFQTEYHAGTTASSCAGSTTSSYTGSSAPSYTESTTSSYCEPERATPITRTSDVAERIAFDSAPTAYHPVDQSVEYNSSAVTHHHESSSLMDQVVAARKESALQNNDAYKNELRKELIPSYTLGKDAPVQIFAAAKTRQNTPQPTQKPKAQSGSLNSLLEAKQNKRQVPPTQAKTELLSHQAQLAPPTQANQAVEVPSFLGRMRDAVEPGSAVQSTNQSLEQQMVNSSNHQHALGGNAFSSALGRANAARVSAEGSAEHLNNVLVSYHTINSLIQAGKVHEAQAVANCALESISQCSGSEPQLMPLVRAFIQLFEQRNMPVQAAAFQAKEQSFCNQMATAGSNLARNVWGA